MAEHEPLTPERRRASPAQVRRRRLVALTALVGAVVLVVVAVAVALPHVRHERAAPPPPPPPPKPFRVIFPEGFTRSQMAQRVVAVAKIARRKRGKPVKLSGRLYLRATRTATVPCFAPRRRTNLEGFLFPATYDFLGKTTSRQLVGAQLQAFCGNWRSVNLKYAKRKNLTPYDVLTIASMIEAETLAPDERRLVSAVIYNRLHAHMPLGIDATIRYALDIPGTQSLRQSELKNPTPYNTRLYPGLPPTPIGNPGLASMQAAAHPAQVNYLYFVRKPDKVHHFFTASFSAFQNYANAHGY